MHYEMPTVLRMRVFLACKLSFRLLWLNSGTVRRGRCRIMPARGTGNFDIMPSSSGNRHKFTSLFNCASLVHPCTSVACCQTKFPVPLTALIRHLHFGEPCRYSDKHWKDCFNHKKKNTHIRTVVFRRER